MSEYLASPSISVSYADGWSQVLGDPEIREAGGEHNNEGVDFARYWAISALVNLELTGCEDYALLFEYLQDVAILDSSKSPGNALLYQLKKKERGGWSKTDLCKRDVPKTEQSGTQSDGQPKQSRGKKQKKLKASSHLGKLYLCIERLAPYATTTGIFLSNAPMALSLASGGQIPPYSKTRLSHLLQDECIHIETKIGSEIGVSPPLLHRDALFVEQTAIAPAAMRDTVRGIISAYLCKQFPSVPNVSGQLVETLIDAFAKCSGPKPSMWSLSEILTHKGFTRSDFTRIVAQACTARAFSSRLDDIADCLLKEGMASRLLSQVRQAVVATQTHFLRDPTTKDTLRWDCALAAAGNTDSLGEYSASIDQVVGELEASFKYPNASKPNKVELISVAILAIMHVEQQSTSPSAQLKK
jgi:hypothetical protein